MVGTALLRGGVDLLALPATQTWAVLYSLATEETADRVERRTELDDWLDRHNPIDRETWGKSPAQQRAQRAAMRAAGEQG